MPQKIIIVRHGETDHNVNRILQGWLDVPLNKDGLSQAQKVAIRLKNISPAAIYSSDQKRAFTTASSIGLEIGIEPIPTPALREDYLGIFQGWQWESAKDPYLEKAWLERHQAREKGELFYRQNGVESLHHHLSRVKNFLYELERNHEDDVVIVVSHGGTINRIMEIMGFINFKNGYVSYKNTSVSTIEKIAGEYQLIIDNDISHL